ncbi:YcxB family protein [Streptomyces sp. TRM68367]|uniref:YcxB family protein n=1 Tax=Streptomyces sp. TRM68367 TaxID=2758415 RepID=UPI00165CE9A2|nr:YcxB family protein [Streptomyces sp. TRM68367]MBC9731089.1 YcxB family protein [Streptomyces sp. TRM68367]
MAEGREATDAVEERPVELAYRPTVDDLEAAIRTRAKSTRAGRFRRRLMIYTLVVTAVAVLLSTLGDGHRDRPWPLYLAVVAFVAFMTAVPRLQARQFHRLSERQGDFRVAVDDTGIRLTTDHSSATLDWHLYPRHAETPELFVLLSADKSAVGVVVLPKRGLSNPEDADRLRAILDRHLVRADAAAAPDADRTPSRGRAVGRGAGSVGLLLLGLVLLFFAYAAVQKAADPDAFPGLQHNNAPVSAVALILGVWAVAGAWWGVRRMKVMRIVTAVLAAAVLLVGGAALYRIGPMLHCWGSDRIARGPDGDYACYDF